MNGWPEESSTAVPRILQVLPELETGGVERTAVDIAAAIQAAGWRAYVASAGGPLVHEITRVGAVHVDIPLASKNLFRMRANTTRLVDLIEAEGIDLVHARSRAPAWSARAAARRTGRPFVTTYHGIYNETNGLKRAYNAIMAKGDRVIANSNYTASVIQQRYGTPEEVLVTIPRGIDLTRYDPAAVSAERIIQLAQRWRLPDGQPVVMLPGRLTRWKGQAVLLRALAELGRRDLVCLLIGADQGRSRYRAELEDLIQSFDLGGVARIVDHCNDMPAAYMLADVIVSASTDPEAFGRVAVEAQAMGRPVIATDHGGGAETVIPGRTGWLTPPGDASALAAALGQAIDLESGGRDMMAAAGRSRAIEEYSLDVMCARTLEVYWDLLGQP